LYVGNTALLTNEEIDLGIQLFESLLKRCGAQ